MDMEDIIKDQYFILSDPHDVNLYGKAQVVGHIHGPYYSIRIFDCAGLPDHLSVMNLENMVDLPLFPSLDTLNTFVKSAPRYEPTKTEISH